MRQPNLVMPNYPKNLISVVKKVVIGGKEREKLKGKNERSEWKGMNGVKEKPSGDWTMIIRKKQVNKVNE